MTAVYDNSFNANEWYVKRESPIIFTAFTLGYFLITRLLFDRGTFTM
jgi:hypothetical protein